MKTSLANLVAGTLAIGTPMLASPIHAAAFPASTVSAAPAEPTLSPRAALTAIPPSAQLNQAVAQFRINDPSASFTWLRGHVDAFSTRPKPSVPDYARPILSAHGVSSAPVAQPQETTTTLPNLPSGSSAEPIEDPSSGNIGFNGSDDPQDAQSGAPAGYDNALPARNAPCGTSRPARAR